MDIDDAEIAELVARMDATRSVLVPWRRRRAARRLASVRSPAAARALVTAYVSHHDDQVVAIAEAALAGLDDQAWASMIAELVRWRRRYDVEVGDATRGAGSTDVEIGD